MKQSLFLVSLVLVFLWAAAQEGVSAVDDHRRTIIFSATGFTNHSGQAIERRRGAVRAARHLAQRKLIELLGGPNEASRHLSTWADFFNSHLQIIETTSLPVDERQAELTGVRIFGTVVVEGSGAASPWSNSSSKLLQPVIATDKKIFSRGERIVFSISGNRDFYATILDRNDQGEIIQLLPNGLRTDNHFDRDRRHHFPDPDRGDNFNLEVSPPFGRELIYLIASDHQLSGPLERHRQDLFAAEKGSVDELLERITAEQMQNLKSQEQRAFSTVQISTRKLTLQTRERE